MAYHLWSDHWVSFNKKSRVKKFWQISRLNQVSKWYILKIPFTYCANPTSVTHKFLVCRKFCNIVRRIHFLRKSIFSRNNSLLHNELISKHSTVRPEHVDMYSIFVNWIIYLIGLVQRNKRLNSWSVLDVRHWELTHERLR